MYEKYAKRRDELGLTDYKVAQKSGVLTSTLSEWKNHHESGGKRGYQPKIAKLTAIANAVNMRLSDLIE